MTDDQQGSVPAPQGTTPTDPTAVDATVTDTTVTDTTAPLAADATPADPAPADPTPAVTSTEAPTTETTSTESSEATTETSATPVVAAVGYGAPAAPTAYAQAGYGQPAYGQPTPATGTDGMSIAALVTGILGMGLIPLILGILGLKRTKANGTSGRGFAIAGIVLGALGIVISTVVAISLVIGGAAALEAVNEASDAASAAAEDLEALEPLPTEEEVVEDDTALSAAPLKDVIPLEAGTFTSAGLEDEATVVAAGGLEGYRTTYTNGVDTVVAVVSDWATAEDAVAFATGQTAGFTPEQLVEQGPLEGVDGQYWIYLVDGVTTLITTNDTYSLTFAGTEAAVYELYQSFPI